MVARLVVEEGDLKGLSLLLEGHETWVIGRDPEECQLLIEDPLISRKHLIARRTPEGMVVENLSSTNPTLVNEEDMERRPRLLRQGDLLKIGNQVLRFYDDISPAMIEKELSPKAESNASVSFEQKKEAVENSPFPPRAPLGGDSVLGKEEEEEGEDLASLTDIDFGVIETGRWLLKVVGGPNNGAEFYMEGGKEYLLGTDPKSCDIVFQDISVSRQHARITVTQEETLWIEDLKSRNGVFIDGKGIEEKQLLPLSTLIALGTTSFVVYDREGEMQTIISPLLPSLVKVLQHESEKTEPPPPSAEPEPFESPPQVTLSLQPSVMPAPPKPPRQLASYIVLTAIIGLFTLAAIGTFRLFYEQPVVLETQENGGELIQQVLKPFPAIRWTFNKSNGGLLLLGHLSNLADKNQLLYHLGTLTFIKNIDDAGVILDEGVLNEVNSLLSNNPTWKGITVHSPAAGQFILTGELRTRREAEQLSSYLSLNFPYLDLLKKQIVVDEDVVNAIKALLHDAKLLDVVPKMANGEIVLTGTTPPNQLQGLNEMIAKIKQIPGIRVVTNQVRNQIAEPGVANISDHYPVKGKSRIGSKLTVVINGRILSEGDELDGMKIISITPQQVMLQRGQDRFRIDY